MVSVNDQNVSPFTNEVTALDDRNWGDNRLLPKDDCIRIGFWNCGGLPLDSKDHKNTNIRQWITHHQFDVFGLSEINVHWPKIEAAHRLPERTRGWFESLHINYTYLKAWSVVSPAQTGGTVLLSINKAAHRVCGKEEDGTGMGRWCSTLYRGKNGRKLRIISAYRCVLNSTGALSAWSQQRLHLDRHNESRDPREVFIIDLVKQIELWITAGEFIVLGLDLNESIVSSSFTTKLAALGLGDILTTRHGHPPPTYIRGSTAIDGIYVSPSLMEMSCGFCEFFNDHRPSWIDIPFHLIFGDNVTTIPRKARRLQLQDPRIVARYIEALSEFCDEHQLLPRIQSLAQRSDVDQPSFLQEYDILDGLRTRGMQLAESKCRKLRMGAIPYTPEYDEVAQRVITWKLILKWKLGGSLDTRYFARRLQQSSITKIAIRSMTLEQVQSHLKLAYQRLNAFSKVASQRRNTWLEELCAARALLSGLSQEQEEKTMVHRERQRTEARIIKAVTKPGYVAGLTTIQIRQGPILLDVSSKTGMEDGLCTELAARFHQASTTPFASEPLLSLVGKFGTGEGAQQILNGTFICPQNLDIWTKKLIPHLRYIPSAQAVMANFPLSISVLQHEHGWKKMKENTSAGYSKLTFAQFKAAAADESLQEMDALFAHIPYSSGISPTRWRHGINIMLQKQQGNFFVEKLRAILLYEADFNQNNKLFGKDLMWLAEDNNAIAIEQFGSRKGMSAIDQSLNKALTFDLWRQTRSPGAMCSNDAKACYDRIVHNFASLCLQRIGAPVPPIISMFSTIQSLQHHVRTVHGDSERTFSGDTWQVPIHGVGQGNGAGPQIWAAVSTPLLNMVRSEGCGSLLCSAISHQLVHFVGYAFVDDTDLVSSSYLPSSTDTVYAGIQQSLNAWQGGINASGGAIVPEKSHWYLVDFKWSNGIPSYISVADSPGPLTVLDSAGTLQALRQLEPWAAERTLGVRLAPDGNMKAQAEFMRSQALSWCNLVSCGNLNHHLTTHALTTTIMKTLEYPLPATMLSKTQCDHIMQPILTTCLPRMKVVRSFPRALTHASSEHLGLQIPNLYWLQGYFHLERLIRYATSMHLTGQLLRHSLENFRIELGCNGSLFDLPYNTFGILATSSWITSTWEFVSNQHISFNLPVPELTLQRSNDALLIPTFVLMGFEASQLLQLNRCRIFLQVTSVSDITCGFGTSITSDAWEGRKSSHRSQYMWPNQANLPAEYWVTWRLALGKLCLRSRTLRLPLGAWLPDCTPTYFYDVREDRVYTMQDDEAFFYSRFMAGIASRSHCGRYGNKQPCTSIPMSALPATTYLNRAFIHLTGYAAQACQPQVILPDSFLEYVKSSIPLTAQWAVHNIQCVGSIATFHQRCRSTAVSFQAVSDGSFKDHHGTASWRISVAGCPEYIMGSLIVPGPSECQSAYRSELAGIYGISITLWALQKFFECSIDGEIGCDGLSALAQCAMTVDTINPNMPHFDLIYAIRHLIRDIVGTFSWRHIKGHQDDDGDASLDQWALDNIQMDTAAKQHWAETYAILESERSHLIYYEPASVVLDGVKVCMNLKARLLSFLGASAAIQYWTKKFAWNEVQGSMINWRSLGQAQRTLTRPRQIWLVKNVTGFFAHGQNMKRWKFREDSTCPRCPCPEEDKFHIVRCQQPAAATLWSLRIDELQQWLIAQSTSVRVAQTICARLRSWALESAHTPIPQDMPCEFQEVFRVQDIIGWYPFLQGFWSAQWEGVQARYLQSLEVKTTVRRWISAVLRRLWQISWDMWEHRNGILHDNELGALSAQLNREITAQFHLGSAALPLHTQSLFTTLPAILASPVSNRQMWLQRVIASRTRAQNNRPYNNERRIMRNWLTPR